MFWNALPSYDIFYIYDRTRIPMCPDDQNNWPILRIRLSERQRKNRQKQLFRRASIQIIKKYVFEQIICKTWKPHSINKKILEQQ